MEYGLRALIWVVLIISNEGLEGFDFAQNVALLISWVVPIYVFILAGDLNPLNKNNTQKTWFKVSVFTDFFYFLTLIGFGFWGLGIYSGVLLLVSNIKAVTLRTRK